jgi:hypothetical protein
LKRAQFVPAVALLSCVSAARADNRSVWPANLPV